MWSFLAHWFGLDNAAGPQYLFWSGFGADLGLIGASVTLIRKHNCDRRRCWRIGRFRFGDRLYCKRHHPHDAPDGPSGF